LTRVDFLKHVTWTSRQFLDEGTIFVFNHN